MGPEVPTQPSYVNTVTGWHEDPERSDGKNTSKMFLMSGPSKYTINSKKGEGTECSLDSAKKQNETAEFVYSSKTAMKIMDNNDLDLSGQLS